MSLAYIGSYTQLEGGHIVVPDGYESIIKTIGSKINKDNILLNHPVTKIEYNLIDDGKCKVSCSDERTFSADFVVVTMPVGFLKENASHLFSPGLSIEKMSAIDNIGFGTVDRIYSEFENLDFMPESSVGELNLVKEQSPVENEENWENRLFGFYVQNTPNANILTSEFCIEIYFLIT